MTLAEFKAWFDGFTEGKDGLSADQLATLRQKLEKCTHPFSGLTYPPGVRSTNGIPPAGFDQSPPDPRGTGNPPDPRRGTYVTSAQTARANK